MEFIVGTALGGAGLAVGLAALFSTCLQVWDFVDAGKAHAKSFSLLRTKLDNQRMLFMIWGTALGFGSPSSYDKRLDNPMVKPIIEANLNHILRILSATETLSKRYGIEVLKKEPQALVRPVAPGLFQSKHASFLNKLRKQQKETSLWKVTRWAIRDEQKFDILVKDLREIIEDLERITTKFTSLTEVVELAQEAVNDIDDLHSLEEIQEASGETTTIISSAASVRQRVIEARTISTMSTDRESFYIAPTTPASGVSASPKNIRAIEKLPPSPGPQSHQHPYRSTAQRDLAADEDIEEHPPVKIGAKNGYTQATDMASFVSENVNALSATLEGMNEHALPHGVSRRIFKEISAIVEMDWAKDPYSKEITLASLNNSLSDFIATIRGPSDTPYSGGLFHLRIQLTDAYPLAPPRVWFWTKIYHPNIESTGAICLDILKHNWSHIIGLRTLLLHIQVLLGEPNPDDPVRAEIGSQLKNDKPSFEKMAREWTDLYATGELLFPGMREDGFCNTTTSIG